MTERNLDAEIRARIDSFLSEISLLVKEAALLSVKEALGGGSAAPAAPARKARGVRRARSAGKRGRRSSQELAEASEKLLAHIRANPGQRLEQIGVALGTPTSVLKRPVAKLLAAGKLRTEGQRRGTRYFVGGGRRGRGRRKKA